MINGSFFEAISTRLPAFGFRPMYEPYSMSARVGFLETDGHCVCSMIESFKTRY
jgi:hypothetical protein